MSEAERNALGNYRLAWAAMDAGIELTRDDPLGWLALWGNEFDHCSLKYDAAVSLAHPHPRDLGAVQQRAWMARLDATLIREVAF